MTLTKLGRGNNNLEEKGSATADKGSMRPLEVANVLIAPVSSWETTNPNVGATTTVSDHVHGSMEGSGGATTNGLPLMRKGIEGE